MLATLLVLASTINLQATDGTRIAVDVATQHQDQTGNSVEVWIAGLNLRLSQPGRDTVAVVVGNCGGIGSSSYSYAVSCRPEGGRIAVSEECHVDAAAADTRKFVRNTLPELRFHGRFREGRTEDCSYELAIVRDGVWLVDPVNGGHNFRLDIP